MEFGNIQSINLAGASNRMVQHTDQSTYSWPINDTFVGASDFQHKKDEEVRSKISMIEATRIKVKYVRRTETSLKAIVAAKCNAKCTQIG